MASAQPCPDCGTIPANPPTCCMEVDQQHYADLEDDVLGPLRDRDDYYDQEPIGSCEWCSVNLYPDDEYDGLCDQCAWLAEH